MKEWNFGILNSSTWNYFLLEFLSDEGAKSCASIFSHCSTWNKIYE
jgi:hypothetical protein